MPPFQRGVLWIKIYIFSFLPLLFEIPRCPYLYLIIKKGADDSEPFFNRKFVIFDA